MNTDTSISKWKIAVLFGMIFLVGALTGSVATKFYVKKRLMGVVRGDFAKRKTRIVRLLDRRLNLTPSQRRQVQEIIFRSQERLMALRDSHLKQMRQIVRETEKEIGSCLNPKQRSEFQSMCKKMEGRWKRWGVMRMPRHRMPQKDGRGMMHRPPPWRERP